MPAADRVVERRALLLEAGLNLLGTEGWSGTSVRAICQWAQLNARYFYESFDGLDDLVVALYDQLVVDLREQVRAAVETAGDDSRAMLRATVETTIRFIDEDHRRARVMYVEALGNERLNQRRLETGFRIAGYVEADTAWSAKEDQAGMITAFVLVGGFSELLMAWLNGVITISREELADDATELFAAMSDAAATISARRNT